MTKYNSYEEKKNWMRSLKVGDQIQDCRFKICEIVDIKPEYGLKSWIGTILNYMHYVAPDKLMNTLYNFLEKKDWANEITDQQITADDQSCCSAMHCADSLEVAEEMEKLKGKRNDTYRSS